MLHEVVVFFLKKNLKSVEEVGIQATGIREFFQ